MAADLWSKRTLFREWVQDAKAKLSASSVDAVATPLGIAASSLRKYLTPTATHRPSTDVLQRLGDLLGRDYRTLLDDPTTAPPGIDPGKWAKLSQKKRVLASAMLEDLLAIPDGEEDAYFALWEQGQAIGRTRRVAEGPSPRRKPR